MMLIRREAYIQVPGEAPSRLWMPMKWGLDNPTVEYIKTLERFGFLVGHIGASGGFGGGGAAGTNTFVIPLSSIHGGSGTISKLGPTVDTTYYLGIGGIGDSGTYSEQSVSCVLPVACTLKAAYWHVHSSGSTSAGNVTHAIRYTESTNTSGTAFAWSAASNTGSETGLAVSLSAGNRFVGIIGPTPSAGTWATPPTNISIHAGVYFQV